MEFECRRMIGENNGGEEEKNKGWWGNIRKMFVVDWFFVL